MSVLSNQVAAAASLTPSKLALQFDDWAKTVKLNTTIIYDPGLPKFLKNILTTKPSIPKWVGNAEAIQFQQLPPKWKGWAGLIRESIKPTDVTFLDDDDLSKDVEWAMDPILAIVANEKLLQYQSPKPTEADRRAPLDMLLSYIWDHLAKGGFVYRKECTLRLPASTVEVKNPTVDSAIFIQLNELAAVDQLEAEASQVCSSLASGKSAHRRLLHWVFEFKRYSSGSNGCLNQVLFGLASGLYQRRALGHPHHFVFGTVHEPPSTLKVLAATWASESEPGQPVGQLKDLWSKDQNMGGAHSVPRGIEAAEKIVVYHLKNFLMNNPDDMFQFYLLMRKLQNLGQQYAEEIKRLPLWYIPNLKAQHPRIYYWPPGLMMPPQPTKRSRTASIAPNPDTLSNQDEKRIKVDKRSE